MKTKNDTIGLFVLIATICASGMAFLEQSALNVALPALQRDLNATSADLLWIVNLYNLLLGALILVGGSLGDHFGRVRIFRIGIIIFTVGSIACGIAPNVGLLILARGVQGVGGALMIPGSLAIISAFFSGSERGQAIGTWSSVTTITSVAGPLLGGFLADKGLWRVNFFILIPFSVIALYALTRVPESRDEHASAKLDYWGALLITLGLGGIVYGATEIGRVGLVGFSNPINLIALIGGLVALVAFVVVESRSDHPLISLDLFKSRVFSSLNAFTFFLYGALSVGLFFFTLQLVQVQGYSATEAGSTLLPFSILLILLSPYAGRWADRNGAKLPLMLGCALVGVGFLLLAPDYPKGFANYWTSYFFAAIVLGLGMSLIIAPLTASVMGALSQDRAGVASGVNNAVSRTAGVLATAILGGVALVLFANLLSPHLLSNGVSQADVDAIMSQPISFTTNSSVDAITTAYQTSFHQIVQVILAICAGFAWLSGVIVWRTLDSKKPSINA